MTVPLFPVPTRQLGVARGSLRGCRERERGRTDGEAGGGGVARRGCAGLGDSREGDEKALEYVEKELRQQEWLQEGEVVDCRPPRPAHLPTCHRSLLVLPQSTQSHLQLTHLRHRKLAEQLPSTTTSSSFPLSLTSFQVRTPALDAERHVSTSVGLRGPPHAEARGSSLLLLAFRDQVGLAHGFLFFPLLQYSVLIMGLDNAGKTTFLGPYPFIRCCSHEQRLMRMEGETEKVKSTFNQTPEVDPKSIAPTIGQNSGSSPSS